MRALFLRLLAVFLGGMPAAPALALDVPEYQLKSALLYNFALFTEWPSRAFADSRTPLGYCVIGEDPFGASLDALAEKQVNNRRIDVRRIARTELAPACHVLFISHSEQANVARILEAVSGYPVLTVMDQEGMARRGVMINLVLENRRVGFEVNAEAVKRAGLALSSKMLRLARAVY